MIFIFPFQGSLTQTQTHVIEANEPRKKKEKKKKRKKNGEQGVVRPCHACGHGQGR